MQKLRKCLVVDDANVVRKVARVLFEDMKFEVAEAESGKDALEICKAEMPNLIVLDRHMPGMTSTDFLTQLRALSAPVRPFVLYLTTEIDVTDISKAFQAGADDYLLKPFNRHSIEEKLDEISTAIA